MQAGTFYWYELATSDPHAAAEFYAAVVGWHFSPNPHAPEGMTYLIGMAGETPAAAIMSYRDDMPRPEVTRWWGNVLVDDVDAVVERITAAGGTIAHPPADAAGIERSAAVADPQGAGFLVTQPHAEPGAEMPSEPVEAIAPPAMPAGAVGWHELVATPWSPMFDFYAGLFGWKKDAMAVPMGDGDVYQLIEMGGAVNGAMMTAQEGQPTGWTFYFAVADIDAAKARIEAAGGMVVMGPQEVPGGAWIVIAVDPQGGPFALVGPRL